MRSTYPLVPLLCDRRHRACARGGGGALFAAGTRHLRARRPRPRGRRRAARCRALPTAPPPPLPPGVSNAVAVAQTPRRCNAQRRWCQPSKAVNDDDRLVKHSIRTLHGLLKEQGKGGIRNARGAQTISEACTSRSIRWPRTAKLQALGLELLSWDRRCMVTRATEFILCAAGIITQSRARQARRMRRRQRQKTRRRRPTRPRLCPFSLHQRRRQRSQSVQSACGTRAREVASVQHSKRRSSRAQLCTLCTSRTYALRLHLQSRRRTLCDTLRWHCSLQAARCQTHQLLGSSCSTEAIPETGNKAVKPLNMRRR